MALQDLSQPVSAHTCSFQISSASTCSQLNPQPLSFQKSYAESLKAFRAVTLIFFCTVQQGLLATLEQHCMILPATCHRMIVVVRPDS